MHSAPRGAFAATPSATAAAADGEGPASPTSSSGKGLPSYLAWRRLSADRKRGAWLAANPYLMGKPDPRSVAMCEGRGIGWQVGGLGGRTPDVIYHLRHAPAAPTQPQVFGAGREVCRPLQPNPTQPPNTLPACPWPGREAVIPPECADPSDAFGLLRRCIPRRIGGAEGPKARVLVCAPSNSALDEIVLRLITLGLTDQDGRVFTPNVVGVCS